MSYLQNGKVYLVGGGPGDPDLLTLKGYKALQSCDVVIYDALINPELVDHSPPHADRIFVGTPRSAKRLSQDEINREMIHHAQLGKTVVRLKGGDPFVFGRGGEEALALIAAGIAWEVVPGITSGIAATAYAGIPVTHRRMGCSVAFVTGHEAEKMSPAVDWDKLSTAVDTIVIYMGVKKFPLIVEKLLRAGRHARTPVAIIESGTNPDQAVYTGLLSTILDQPEVRSVRSPAIIVIGEVASLHKQLEEVKNSPLLRAYNAILE